MHRGEIREMGTHAELLEKEGIYYRLYQLQYEREEWTMGMGHPGVKLID